MAVRAVEAICLVSETAKCLVPTVQEKPDTSQLSNVVDPHGAALVEPEATTAARETSAPAIMDFIRIFIVSPPFCET